MPPTDNGTYTPEAAKIALRLVQEPMFADIPFGRQIELALEWIPIIARTENGNAAD